MCYLPLGEKDHWVWQGHWVWKEDWVGKAIGLARPHSWHGYLVGKTKELARPLCKATQPTSPMWKVNYHTFKSFKHGIIIYLRLQLYWCNANVFVVTKVNIYFIISVLLNHWVYLLPNGCLRIQNHMQVYVECTIVQENWIDKVTDKALDKVTRQVF